MHSKLAIITAAAAVTACAAAPVLPPSAEVRGHYLHSVAMTYPGPLTGDLMASAQRCAAIELGGHSVVAAVGGGLAVAEVGRKPAVQSFDREAGVVIASAETTYPAAGGLVASTLQFSAVIEPTPEELRVTATSIRHGVGYPLVPVVAVRNHAKTAHDAIEAMSAGLARCMGAG